MLNFQLCKAEKLGQHDYNWHAFKMMRTALKHDKSLNYSPMSAWNLLAPITHLHKLPWQFISEKFLLLLIVDCQGLLLLLKSLDLLEQGVADKFFLLLCSCLLLDTNMGITPEETSVRYISLAYWHSRMFYICPNETGATTHWVLPYMQQLRVCCSEVGEPKRKYNFPKWVKRHCSTSWLMKGRVKHGGYLKNVLTSTAACITVWYVYPCKSHSLDCTLY